MSDENTFVHPAPQLPENDADTKPAETAREADALNGEATASGAPGQPEQGAQAPAAQAPEEGTVQKIEEGAIEVVDDALADIEAVPGEELPAALLEQPDVQQAVQQAEENPAGEAEEAALETVEQALEAQEAGEAKEEQDAPVAPEETPARQDATVAGDAAPQGAQPEAETAEGWQGAADVQPGEEPVQALQAGEEVEREPAQALQAGEQIQPEAETAEEDRFADVPSPFVQDVREEAMPEMPEEPSGTEGPGEQAAPEAAEGAPEGEPPAAPMEDVATPGEEPEGKGDEQGETKVKSEADAKSAPQGDALEESVVIMAPGAAAAAPRQRRAAQKPAAKPPAKRPRKAPPPEELEAPAQKERSVALLIIGNAFKFFFKFVFIMVCLVAVVGSIAAVKVSEYMVESTANDADWLDLDTIRLAQTSYIMALNPDNPNAREEDDWIPYQELTGPQEHRIWVALSEIPDDMIHAVISIEDREFYNHHGVSFKRTILAFGNEILGFQDDQFGASTIDQQLVKNLTGEKVVADAEGDMTPGYQRKLREIFRAWGLNNRYSKDMIMEAYLNTMALSEMNAGVQAGALEYFNKDVKDLTLGECATIAGITRAPTYYSPFQNPENCLNRRNSVLYQMYETGYITLEQYNEEKERPLGLRERQTQAEKEAASTVFTYYSDAVLEDVIRDVMAKTGYDRSGALNYIYTGGLRIECAVDWNLQRYVEEMYESGYDEDGFFTNTRDARGRDYKTYLTVQEKDEDGNVTDEILPQSAVAIIDYDGALKAVAGGIGEKTSSLTQNRATQSVRQVGSTMKPIAAYALGIDSGYIDYGTSIVDSGVRNKDGSAAAVDPESGVPRYNWPRNFSGTYRNTGMPVVSAIAESTNTVAVKVGQIVGVQEMFEFLRDTLQISSLVEEGPYNDLDLGPLVLGSLTNGISPYELAGAYMMFGNGGQYKSLHTYERVRDANGNVVLEPEMTTVQAISPETAYIMNRMLWTVVHRGGAPGVSSTAAGMAPEGELDAVAKTGTTSDDKDRWFVGLTPYYVTAVWWGYDYNYSLERWSPAASGNIPPNVWKNIMEHAQDGFEYKEFPGQPETVMQANFCTLTGNLAGPGCPSARGYYNTNLRVPSTCSGHAAPEPAEGEAPPEG